MRRFALQVTAISLAAGSPAYAVDDALRATSDWQVQNRGTYCLAYRAYEDDKGRPVVLRVRSSIGDNAAIYVEAMGGKGPKRAVAEVGELGLDGEPHMLDILSWRAGDGTVVRRVILNNELAAKFAATRYLEYRRPGLSKLELDISGYADAADAVKRCKDVVSKEWELGMGEAGPRSNLTELFTTDDYPETVLRRGGQGKVEARLFVDEQGKTVQCNIEFSSGYVLFDQTVCGRFMERASFDPALTMEGKARKGTYLQSVQFSVVR